MSTWSHRRLDMGCAKRGAGQRRRLRERPGEECLSNPYIKLSDGRPTETEGTSEMKKYLIASVLIVGVAGSAYALNGQFSNMCSWGLANHKDVQTDCSVNETIKGKTYCFSNEQAKTEFMKDPDANLAKAKLFYGEKQG